MRGATRRVDGFNQPNLASPDRRTIEIVIGNPALTAGCSAASRLHVFVTRLAFAVFAAIL